MIIDQALILAAGRGERMSPLTDTIPKPLAKIKEKSMIDYIIEKISFLPAISKIVVNSYYLANILESHIKSLNNTKIIISHENKKLETGGGLLNALHLFDKNKPILIVNGDIFWVDENNSLLEKMIKNFDAEKMDILMALKPKEQFVGYEGKGDFDLDAKGNLTKNNSEYHSHTYIGVQIIHPRILENAPQEECFSLSYFFKDISRIKGLEMEEEIFHVGTVKDLKDLNQRL